MSETIYVLTVIYFVYVVYVIEGERIGTLFKKILPVDFVLLQKTVTTLRDRFFNSFNFKSIHFA